MLLSSDLWVGALIRRAEIEGAHAVVVNKGDARAGAVIDKAYDPPPRTARPYADAFGPEGERQWSQPGTPHREAKLDAYIARQRQYDPDLWIVEIEDRQGRHFLTEKVQG